MEWDTSQEKRATKKSFRARIKSELVIILDKENVFLQTHKITHKLKSFK